MLFLRSLSEKVNLYPSNYMLEDNKKSLTIDDVSSDEHTTKFIHSDLVPQKGDFFETATWTRFDNRLLNF